VLPVVRRLAGEEEKAEARSKAKAEGQERRKDQDQVIQDGRREENKDEMTTTY